jgi:hypothetical protein
MTQEQLKEKKIFMAMIHAIAKYKNLKGIGNIVSKVDDNFFIDKFNLLSEEVKQEVRADIRANNERIQEIDHNRFARITIAEPPEELPQMPYLPNDLNELVKPLKPRK